MEWRMRNIKFLVLIAPGLAQWRSSTRLETENGQIHQLHSMYTPFDAALPHGPNSGAAGIPNFHTVLTADFTAERRW